MKPPPASHVHRRPWVSHIDSSFGERSGLEAGGKGQFARRPMGMRSALRRDVLDADARPVV